MKSKPAAADRARINHIRKEITDIAGTRYNLQIDLKHAIAHTGPSTAVFPETLIRLARNRYNPERYDTQQCI